MKANPAQSRVAALLTRPLAILSVEFESFSTEHIFFELFLKVQFFLNTLTPKDIIVSNKYMFQVFEYGMLYYTYELCFGLFSLQKAVKSKIVYYMRQ